MAQKPPPWRCPIHKQELIESTGTMMCTAGQHAYPIRNNIPRFVPDSSYSEAFGAQWKKFRRTQLDSFTGTTISADRARRCLGEDLWRNLARKNVLEVGCGAGRFTEVLLARGAHVTSVDLSEAVEANQENFPQNAKHRIVQANVLSLPFGPYQYDVVFCLGVIQHTPDPETTLRMLYEQVKPGGYLVIDHYTHSLFRYTTSRPLFRQVLTRVPPEQSLWITEQMVNVLFPIHEKLSRYRIPRALLSRISPITTYLNAYPQLSMPLQKEWAMLDTHDALTDKYKHFRTQGQIERALRKLGGSEIHCIRAGNGIEARCRQQSVIPEENRLYA
jgi:SAM-dependent methyltransferase